MWLANTDVGNFILSNPSRAPDDNSAFAHWLAAGRLQVHLLAGYLDEYNRVLDKMQPGDPVFAYESGVGIVALGWICDPKDLRTSQSSTELFPRDSIVKSLAVDWDASITRTTAEVWKVTSLGGRVLRSCGPKTKFFPLAMAMLQEAQESDQDDRDASEVAAVKRIQSNPAYSPKMQAQLIQARVGQGIFRAAVLAREPACRVTGITQPHCLVASHIKPWAVCVGDEHLDSANGLMLAPHVDHLFDTGLISFEDGGRLLLAPSLDPTILRAWHINAATDVGLFAPDQARYLAYHRVHVFGQPRPRRQRNLVGDAGVDGAIRSFNPE
jgi:hypothetical protein